MFYGKDVSWPVKQLEVSVLLLVELHGHQHHQQEMFKCTNLSHSIVRGAVEVQVPSVQPGRCCQQSDPTNTQRIDVPQPLNKAEHIMYSTEDILRKVHQSSTLIMLRLTHSGTPVVQELFLALCRMWPNKVSQHVRFHALCVLVGKAPHPALFTLPTS